MALTLASIAKDCLAHIRLAASGISDEQTGYLVNSINFALEKMRASSPQTFRKTAEVTWTPATNSSQSMTVGQQTIASGVAGSSVMIDGDVTYNEITGPTMGGVSLLFPYAGTAGTRNVQQWGDSVILDGTVDRVLGAILLHERRPLIVFANRAEWEVYQGVGWNRDYGLRNAEQPVNRLPGIPVGVWIETVLTSSAIEYRARCSPLPNGIFRATLDVQILATEITSDDIATDAITTRPVPGQRTYGILRALCLYHWSGSPWFRNDAARAVIGEAYKEAMEQLTGFRPNADEPVKTSICY